jgi:peptidoglycan/LPS O-acetylase OafA/YrhL
VTRTSAAESPPLDAQSSVPNIGSSDASQWIDALRGAAACAVVFYHINEIFTFTHQPYRWLTKHGWLGVEVFFVISGYLIVSSARRSSSVAGFLIRRWWRIYPPYWLSLFLMFAVAFGRHWQTGTNDVAALPKTLGEALATFSLATAPITDVKTTNWVSWSLTYEVAFYLVVALVFVRNALGAGGLIVVTAACLWHNLGGLPRAPFFLAYWDLFALGTALAWFDRPKIALTLSVLSTTSLLVRVEPEITIVAWLTFISIAIARQPRLGRYFRVPVLPHLGTISYSLYLVHVPIGCYVLARFRPEAASCPPLLHILYDCGIVGVCIGCAWLFWRTIEFPAHEFGRRWSKKVH